MCHHEMIRKQLLSGKIGLEQNRLSTRIRLEKDQENLMEYGHSETILEKQK